MLVGRLTTAGLMVCAALLTYELQTAKEAFDLILSVGAGTGLIYLLRWFWWRINAWSEISAMLSSFLVAIGFFIARKSGMEISTTRSLLITVGITTIVWITTTFLTEPADRATLVAFYKKVRPAGPGWTSVAAEAGVGPSPDSLPQQFLGWALGITFVYSALFGTGSYLYGHTPQALMWTAAFVVSGIGLLMVVPRMWGSSTTG